MTTPITSIPIPLENLVAELRLQRQELTRLSTEVALLRRLLTPPPNPKLEAFLAAWHENFGEAPQAAVWVMERAVEDPDIMSRRLLTTLNACLKSPTENKLSRYLGRSVGWHGVWWLACANSHSRDGALYAVSRVMHR